MNTKKILGITVIAGIVLTFVFLWLSEIAFMDKFTGATIFFGWAWIAVLGITIISFVVWLNMDGRK